jgi:hypothetical protein
MTVLDLAARVLLALGLVLVIGGFAFDARAFGVVGVAFWVLAAAIMIGHAGPRRRGR